MSCRTTKSGTIALRLARLYSGLTDNKTQKLFHALLREGQGLPDPNSADLKWFHTRQKALLRHADMTDRARAQADRDLFRAQAEQPDGPLFHALSLIEVRARQEAVLAEITTAIDLEPPGSQADQYEIGPDGRPVNVWYASYGSNMNKDRFLTYIKGGEPEGATVSHSGSRDDTEPTGDIPIRFDGRMHFAYASSRWNAGGVAFMDVDHAGHALGRAYKITSEQFDDVIAQENGRSITTMNPTPPIDFARVLKDGSDLISTNIYGTLLHIGDYEGAPVLTFTSSFTAQEATLEAALWNAGEKADLYIASNSPSGNYLRMIAKGLNESFNMTEDQQADYLRGCAGAEDWTRREILAVLRAAEPTPPPRRTYTGATGSYMFGNTSTRDVSTDYSPLKESSARPVYGVTPHPTTKPVGMPRFSTSRGCAVCGKHDHTMHDCPQLRKSRPKLAAEQQRENTLAKQAKELELALTNLGMNDLHLSDNAPIMFNRWHVTSITKTIQNQSDLTTTKDAETITLTRFDGKSVVITTDNAGETYDYADGEGTDALIDDANTAFPQTGNGFAPDDFTYILRYTQADVAGNILANPSKDSEPEPEPTTGITRNLLNEALENLVLGDAEPSKEALTILAEWEFLDEDSDNDGWTAQLIHTPTGDSVTVHYSSMNREITHTSGDETALALFDRHAQAAFPNEEEPRSIFTEIVEEVTNLTYQNKDH